MNILLPVDGSEAAERATRHAIALARGEGTAPAHRICLINVQAPIAAPEVLSHMPTSEVEAMQLSRGGDALTPARTMIEAAGVPCVVDVVIGEFAESIAGYADSAGCDQIVMGTRGMSGVRGLFMGSVSKAVLERTTLPVTLVK